MSTNCKVYFGLKMTGLPCDDMIDKAQNDSVVFCEQGLTVYHPVLTEAIPYTHEPLTERTPEEMQGIWDDDKAAVRDAHVLVDSSPHLFSAGLKEEKGKARYRDWKPVVAIYPEGYAIPYIPRKETDYVTTSVYDAAVHIREHWGTRWLRMKWRLPIYLRNWMDVSPRKIIQFFR